MKWVMPGFRSENACLVRSRRFSSRIQVHPTQDIQQGQTRLFELLDQAGSHLGKFRLQAGGTPAGFVQAEDHGGQAKLLGKPDINAHEFGMRHRTHVRVNMGGDDSHLERPFHLGGEFHFHGCRVAMLLGSLER